MISISDFILSGQDPVANVEKISAFCSHFAPI